MDPGRLPIDHIPRMVMNPHHVEYDVLHILQFFNYDHLPVHLMTISKPFCDLAHTIVHGDHCERSGNVTMGPPLPRNPECVMALRKLLEAKDAAVRAYVAEPLLDTH